VPGLKTIHARPWGLAVHCSVVGWQEKKGQGRDHPDHSLSVAVSRGGLVDNGKSLTQRLGGRASHPNPAPPPVA